MLGNRDPSFPLSGPRATAVPIKQDPKPRFTGRYMLGKNYMFHEIQLYILWELLKNIQLSTKQCLRAEPPITGVVIASPNPPRQDFWVFLFNDYLEKVAKTSIEIQQKFSTIDHCREYYIVCFSVGFELFKRGQSGREYCEGQCGQKHVRTHSSSRGIVSWVSEIAA